MDLFFLAPSLLIDDSPALSDHQISPCLSLLTNIYTNMDSSCPVSQLDDNYGYILIKFVLMVRCLSLVVAHTSHNRTIIRHPLRHVIELMLTIFTEHTEAHTLGPVLYCPARPLLPIHTQFSSIQHPAAGHYFANPILLIFWGCIILLVGRWHRSVS